MASINSLPYEIKLAIIKQVCSSGDGHGLRSLILSSRSFHDIYKQNSYGCVTLVVRAALGPFVKIATGLENMASALQLHWDEENLNPHISQALEVPVTAEERLKRMYAVHRMAVKDSNGTERDVVFQYIRYLMDMEGGDVRIQWEAYYWARRQGLKIRSSFAEYEDRMRAMDEKGYFGDD